MSTWKARAMAAGLCGAMLLSGCSARLGQDEGFAPGGEDAAYVDQVGLDGVAIEDEAVAMAGLPADAPLSLGLEPAADGLKTKSNNKVTIDYSHAEDGYVMVQWKNPTTKKIKCLIQGPATKDKWQYDCVPGEWEVFPLSDGNGKYDITVYEQTSGDRYATVLSLKETFQLADEFAPFVRPNQYVNYQERADAALALAAELIDKDAGIYEQIGAVYEYVVDNLTYDSEKAATVKSGYLPVLDDILEAKKGICFDYASLMTAMLRSQGIPCKLVVGYAGSAYHAWVSVWSEDTGWIEGVVFFDGTSWQRMDPTFASSGHNSSAILKYIGDGSHYTVKYLY